MLLAYHSAKIKKFENWNNNNSTISNFTLSRPTPYLYKVRKWLVKRPQQLHAKSITEASFDIFLKKFFIYFFSNNRIGKNSRYDNRAKEASPSKCLIVKNISYIPTHDIVVYFNTFGYIEDVYFNKQYQSEEPCDYYFIYFEKINAAIEVGIFCDVVIIKLYICLFVFGRPKKKATARYLTGKNYRWVFLYWRPCPAHSWSLLWQKVKSKFYKKSQIFKM